MAFGNEIRDSYRMSRVSKMDVWREEETVSVLFQRLLLSHLKRLLYQTESMDALLNAVALEGITQEDIDDAIRMVSGQEGNIFIVGEVYGARDHTGPPVYHYHHDRVHGVLIENVEDDVVTFRYVMDRPITQGGLIGTRPDSVIDAVMECDGPCYDSWIVKDEARTSKILRGEHEFFVDVGEDESVTFCA